MVDASTFATESPVRRSVVVMRDMNFSLMERAAEILTSVREARMDVHTTALMSREVTSVPVPPDTDSVKICVPVTTLTNAKRNCITALWNALIFPARTLALVQKDMTWLMTASTVKIFLNARSQTREDVLISV
jgi:hypothetical protein